MNKSENQSGINVMSLLTELKNHLWLILVWGVIGVVVALVFSTFFLTPKYSSTVDLLVNQKNTDSATQFNVQQADLQAINTYKDVLKKPFILDSVLKNAQRNDNYKGSENDLAKSINISNQANSKVISVTVTDKNAYAAADIANDLASVFTEKIKELMKINNVAIVSKGSVNTNPVFPNKKINVFLGLIIGIILGISIVVIKFLTDKTVKDADFITEYLGLPNLGQIYHITKEEQSFKVVETLHNDGDILQKRHRV